MVPWRDREECLARLLRSCNSPKLLAEGKRIHVQIVESGGPTRYLSNLLVQMYGKCGSLDDARAAFRAIPDGPNLYSWSMMLGASIHNRDLGGARRLFDAMPRRDAVTWNTMISAYTERGEMDRARTVLDRMPRHDVVSWTSVLQGHANQRHLAQANHAMPTRNEVSWTTMLQATAQAGKLPDVEAMFARIPARSILHWSSMLTALAKTGHMRRMEKLFDQMPEWDAVSQTLLVSSYARLGHLDKAKEVFDSMQMKDVVASNAIIAAYARKGDLDQARDVFDEMAEEDRTDVSWLAIIQGYARHGSLRRAAELLKSMPQPHKGAAAHNALITAYAERGHLAGAKATFDSMSADEQDVVSWTAMMAAYAQGGRVDEAVAVFERMPWRDVAAWNAAVAALAHCGRGSQSVEQFHRMILDGVAADELSFTSVLTGCSRNGLLATGREIFASMSSDFWIDPGKDHYCCMVDLLGRCGELAKAEELISSMPFVPDEVVTWMSLLGACKNHRNEEIGSRIADKIFELDPANPTTYVLLAELYLSTGKRDKAEEVKEVMRKKRSKGKEMALTSVIEVDGKQHRFVAGEPWQLHPRGTEIAAEVERLEREIEAAGRKPDDLELADEEERGVKPVHHNERLAIALGMIATPDGTALRIVKNARVCADCHAAAKVVSKVSGRLIVVRDSSRFHYFENGQCSCGGYW